jgi:hypothetical protein
MDGLAVMCVVVAVAGASPLPEAIEVAPAETK